MRPRPILRFTTWTPAKIVETIVGGASPWPQCRHDAFKDAYLVLRLHDAESEFILETDIWVGMGRRRMILNPMSGCEWLLALCGSEDHRDLVGMPVLVTTTNPRPTANSQKEHQVWRVRHVLWREDRHLDMVAALRIPEIAQ